MLTNKEGDILMFKCRHCEYYVAHTVEEVEEDVFRVICCACKNVNYMMVKMPSGLKVFDVETGEMHG